MKIVKIAGGLGNQMFQYAFLLALKHRFPNEEILANLNDFDKFSLHNGYDLENAFGLKLNNCSRKLYKKLSYDPFNIVDRAKRKIFGDKKTNIVEREEDKFTFVDKYFLLKGSYHFDGYWQSYKYFEDIKDEIVKNFKFRNEKSENNIKTLNKILSTESVSMHVRRGDYITHPLFGGICDYDYFINAISKVRSLLEDFELFIFSDDPDWCKNKIKAKNATYIDWNSGDNAYMDMYLMSKCRHNIIANSSFSWWGAYLNSNEKKIVISPSKWKNNMIGTRELIPEYWIKIDV